MAGAAQRLANEDEEQQRKASGQGAHHGYERLFRFAFALGRLGNIKHLDNRAFAALVDAGHLVLFGKKFEQGLVVFVVAKPGDVITVARVGSGLFLFGSCHLGAHRPQLSLSLFEVGCGFGQVATHAGQLDLLCSDARFELGHHLYGRPWRYLENTAVDAAGFEGLVSLGEIVFGIGQLFFEKHPALLSLGDGQAVEQFAQFFQMGVGQLGGKGRVFVASFYADQAVFATGNNNVATQR